MSEEKSDYQFEQDVLQLEQFEQDAVNVTERIVELLRKGMPGSYVSPQFFPEGDYMDRFRKQIHEINVILADIPGMSLSDEEKKELNDLLGKAQWIFYDIQMRKIILNMRMDMKAAIEEVLSKRKPK